MSCMGLFPVVSGFISHLTLHSILYSAWAEMSRQKWQAAKIIVAFYGTFLARQGLGEPLRGWGALWAGVGYVWGSEMGMKKVLI